MHSITTLARLTGVKQETIRTWERRYSVVSPGRDEKGRRVYGEADVRRLRQVADLVRLGHQIGDISAWSDERLEQALEATVAEKRNHSVEYRESLMSALDAKEPHRFEQLIGLTLTSLPPLVATEQVLAPTLGRIGAMWEAGELGSDEEHALSVIIKRQLMLGLAFLAPSANGLTILFSTLSDEHHELGALMACFIAASERHRCAYLGPNLPAEDIARAAKRLDAAAIVLGVVHVRDARRIEDELQRLVDHAPERAQIVLGVGKAAGLIGAPSPIITLHDFGSFKRFLDATWFD